MLFNTWSFAALFCAVALLCFRLRRARSQNLLLLLASYAFYGAWDWRFLGLIWLSTAVDFLIARRMEGRPDAVRKRLLRVSLATNLGILGLFKYCGFFTQSAADLLETLGFEPHLPILELVLPVGISFYTFQTLAYTIDVYRRRTEACRDPLRFALYVCYFPQLIAGPIERAERLLPQFDLRRRFDLERTMSGVQLILVGLLRKVLIADTAAQSVDRAFADPEQFDSLWLARAVFLFALQIYGDFSGYSDMARGTSRILGIELRVNFKRPYFAPNITAFWRRWHMSLSEWLRDYLYIPLGGNRGSKLFAWRNLMLTMLLGGLWHGAGMAFVVWGGLHGLALGVHKLWLRERTTEYEVDRGSVAGLTRSLCGWSLTMATVGLAWIFFRAGDLQTALLVTSRILECSFTADFGALKLPLLLGAVLLLIDLPQALSGRDDVVLRWPWPLQSLAQAAAILALVLCTDGDGPEFLYFQF